MRNVSPSHNAQDRVRAGDLLPVPQGPARAALPLVAHAAARGQDHLHRLPQSARQRAPKRCCARTRSTRMLQVPRREARSVPVRARAGARELPQLPRPARLDQRVHAEDVAAAAVRRVPRLRPRRRASLADRSRSSGSAARCNNCHTQIHGTNSPSGALLLAIGAMESSRSRNSSSYETEAACGGKYHESSVRTSPHLRDRRVRHCGSDLGGMRADRHAGQGTGRRRRRLVVARPTWRSAAASSSTIRSGTASGHTAATASPSTTSTATSAGSVRRRGSPPAARTACTRSTSGPRISATSDQKYRLDKSKAGEHYLTFGWDQIPHVYSTSALTPYYGVGTNQLTLPPGLSTRLFSDAGCTAGGAYTRRAAAAELSRRPSREGPAGYSTTTHQTDHRYPPRHRLGRIPLHPTDDWDVRANYTDAPRTGTQVEGVVFSPGTPASASTRRSRSPTPRRTTAPAANMSALSLWGQSTLSRSATADRPTRTRTDSYTVENPFCPAGETTVGTARLLRPHRLGVDPARAHVALARQPGQRRHRHARRGPPYNSRYMGTVSFNMMRQNARVPAVHPVSARSSPTAATPTSGPVADRAAGIAASTARSTRCCRTTW